MVLAASGVEHEDLLSYAEPLLSDLPKVAPPETPKSVYVGGDYRCQADSPVCIILFMMHLFFLFTQLIMGLFTMFILFLRAEDSCCACF